jgi:hypothetical protein
MTQRPAEAAVIRDAVTAVLAGASLRSICADLNRDGVPTVKGGAWQPRTLKAILTSPRIAGRTTYLGDVIEPDPPLPEIVPEAQWRAVVAKLSDPRRNTSPGPAPRWLVSGIARCGHPDCVGDDRVMRVGTSGRKQAPAYRCSGPREHCARSAPALDAYVTAIVVTRLSRPDAADLLAPPVVERSGPSPSDRANALRAKITEAKQLWRDGTDTTAEYREHKRELDAELAKVNAELTASAGVDPLAGLAGNPDAAAVWARLSLGRRRAIVDALVKITVRPQPRSRSNGGRVLDPDFIDVVAA